MEGNILEGDGTWCFTATVDGDDIVVRSVTATWFGGSNDPQDDGQTASGINTKTHPNILGCALPMHGKGSPNTEGSPIPPCPMSRLLSMSSAATRIRRSPCR